MGLWSTISYRSQQEVGGSSPGKDHAVDPVEAVAFGAEAVPAVAAVDLATEARGQDYLGQEGWP